MSSSDRSWILQYTENRIIPTNTKMLTVSKVLILRATAIKENIVRLTQSSPAAVHVRWPALPPYCVSQEDGLPRSGREGQLAETRGARRIRSAPRTAPEGCAHFLAGHRTRHMEVGRWEGFCWRPRGSGVQPASDALVGFTIRETAARALLSASSYISHARNDAREGARPLGQPTAVAKHLSSATW